jgi:hypothetical protein
MNDLKRWRMLVEAAQSRLTAEPFETVDPISRQPNTSFRIIQNGAEVGIVAGRFAKTPDEAIMHFQEREKRAAVEQGRADAERAQWYDRRSQPTPATPIQSNFEIVDPQTIDSLDDPDDFYYHVTTRPKQVLRRGLRPDRRPSMADGFYRSYSAGKVFFCDRPGVPYWFDRIGDHLESQYDQPPKLSVVRFPKSLVNDAQEDKLGTSDSHAGSYFVTHPIR